MKKLFMTTLFLLAALAGWGMQKDTAKADTSAKTEHKRFFTNWSIRQTFGTPEGQQNPATFALSIPASGRNNWLVDGGISVNLGKLDNAVWSSKLIGEFHRNTLVDIEQYNYQLGYALEKFNERGDGKLSAIWIGNIKYVRDVIDTGSSIATTLNFSLYLPNTPGHFNLGKPGYLDHQKYTYQLNPSVEAQYQQFFGGDTHTRGAILRPLFNLAASFAINKKGEWIDKTETVDGKKVKHSVRKVIAPTKVWELAVNYVNRYAVVNNTGDKEGYTKLLKAGINYYLISTKTSSVSLGANYNLGSDPLNGLKDQQFWQFALQVQF